VCGHIAIITETESTYVMIRSTLLFDNVEDILGLLASPGSSDVTYAIKRTEQEMAWELVWSVMGGYASVLMCK